MSAIKDGASTTLMFAENIHKTYVLNPADPPLFSWLGVADGAVAIEQQLGMVWVADDDATAGQRHLTDQEAINGNADQRGELRSHLDPRVRPARRRSWRRRERRLTATATAGFCADRHRLHRLPAVDDAEWPQVRRSGRQILTRDHGFRKPRRSGRSTIK